MQLGAHLAYFLRQLAERLALPGQPAVAVEQVEVEGRFEQREVLALAVDVDQSLADLLEQPDGRRAPVHPADRAPALANFPGEQQGIGVVALQPFAAEYRVDPRPQRLRPQIEGALDQGGLRAAAHAVAVGAPAQQQRHRVEDDRFPRPGLAGHHVEAGRKAHLERVDDRKIVDGDFCQHRLSWLFSTTGMDVKIPVSHIST
ncbi:MAG: hypothetical protein P8Z40_15025 [Chloroflexota bacterium]